MDFWSLHEVQDNYSTIWSSRKKYTLDTASDSNPTEGNSLCFHADIHGVKSCL